MSSPTAGFYVGACPGAYPESDTETELASAEGFYVGGYTESDVQAEAERAVAEGFHIGGHPASELEVETAVREQAVGGEAGERHGEGDQTVAVRFPNQTAQPPSTMPQVTFSEFLANVMLTCNAALSRKLANKPQEPMIVAKLLKSQAEECEKLLAERDVFKAKLDVVKAERDTFKAKLDVLKAGRDASEAERDTFKVERGAFASIALASQAKHDNIIAERDALKTERNALKAERDALETERDDMEADREFFKAECADLVESNTEFELETAKYATELERLKERYEKLEEVHITHHDIMQSLEEQKMVEARNQREKQELELSLLQHRELVEDELSHFEDKLSRFKDEVSRFEKQKLKPNVV
ncbi:hypothetical protein BDV95DRAFT_598963 [Massariosphaeria phaeospora]|uniref:Uncharacterized protein n=1 Tax=Massariosphaeria phaeospora TaxID=100035 RepID=A0A7C8M2K3_9PLEO|nr:hypothetical protein BDV95DRAFT_598963 [Massariosphaeria phaeospora]